MSLYPAMKRIGFSAHVIDDNLRQRTAGLFCGIIQKPVSPRGALPHDSALFTGQISQRAGDVE